MALIMGVVAISSTRADVLNFAREWSSRKDENKTITSPSQPQADQQKSPASWQKSQLQHVWPDKDKSKAKPSAATRKVTAPSNVVADKQTRSPVAESSLSTAKKETTNVGDIAVLATGDGAPPPLPDSQILGRWIKSLIQHASLSPAEIDVRENLQLSRTEVQRLKDELALRHREIQQLSRTLADRSMTFETASKQLVGEIEKNARQQQEVLTLTERTKRLAEKNAQWQVLTTKLQSSLKEAQYPALPSSDDELEDFAAGMAMGFDILSVLEQRDEQGVHVDKELFLAGIKETIRGERRLSQEDFERHLKRANQRVEDAMHKIAKQKEARDGEWLAKFIEEEGAQAAGNQAWYKVIYRGEQPLADENAERALTISVNRRLADGTVIADSDITGLVLQEKLSDLPEWLQVVAKDIHLHGEAELAVKVDEYGDPREQGNYIEHWRIRVVEQHLL
ncbi:FKBP-type peptidyl-prolyl cis-trans isomerase N-terminal domain-containing protein [Klebsiella michiganensis]|uniref:FKBP-type peptidyl-prolyl cis-trans isomerase N-terminal domain-containing protein n=1 Tax=Klebsiella michiganensis TaxID=1134687 RepID=UPI001E43F8B6|nr:FKBP-type peptidyl-prolyl cis-trans isomerase N-terminal domain-containing protein [Klebsiella michiganensis]